MSLSLNPTFKVHGGVNLAELFFWTILRCGTSRTVASPCVRGRTIGPLEAGASTLRPAGLFPHKHTWGMGLLPNLAGSRQRAMMGQMGGRRSTLLPSTGSATTGCTQDASSACALPGCRVSVHMHVCGGGGSVALAVPGMHAGPSSRPTC